METETKNSSPFASLDSSLCDIGSRLVRTYKVVAAGWRYMYEQSFSYTFCTRTKLKIPRVVFRTLSTLLLEWDYIFESCQSCLFKIAVYLHVPPLLSLLTLLAFCCKRMFRTRSKLLWFVLFWSPAKVCILSENKPPVVLTPECSFKTLSTHPH